MFTHTNSTLVPFLHVLCLNTQEMLDLVWNYLAKGAMMNIDGIRVGGLDYGLWAFGCYWDRVELGEAAGGRGSWGARGGGGAVGDGDAAGVLRGGGRRGGAARGGGGGGG